MKEPWGGDEYAFTCNHCGFWEIKKENTDGTKDKKELP